MAVRPLASLADAAAVLAVRRRAWRAAYEDLLPAAAIEAATTGTTPSEFRAGVGGDGRALLVWEDDAIRGFVSAVWDAAETKAYAGDGDAELRALYVAPERWREGVGTDLLAAATAALPDRERLVLACLRGNDRARRFYEARGFERVSSATVDIDGRRVPTVVYARPL